MQNLDEGRKKMDQGFDFYAAADIYITGGKKNSVCVVSRMEEEEEKLFGA